MKKFIFLLASLVVLTSLAACGGSKTADLIFSNGAEPQTLDPNFVYGVPEHYITSGLFEGLVIYDPKTSKAYPGIAEKWETSPDQLTVTFHLRPNLKWSDGTAITAQTVYDSWMRELDPATAAPYAYLISNTIVKADDFVKGKAKKEEIGMKVVDPLTFQVQLVGPTPYFIDMLANDAFSVVPLETIKKFGPAWTKPENIVVNGPYMLKEWKPNQYILFAKNPKYWNADAVKLKTIKILPIDDLKTAYNMFKQGQIDWVYSAPLDLIDEIKLRPDFQVAPNFGTYYYLYNVTEKPFTDARVRKALAMAIDREALVTQVTRGGQVATKTYVPPMDGYTAPAGLPYDVATAKKLLADAGYPDGKGFPKFTLLYNTLEGHKKMAEFVQDQLKKNLGIDVELKNQEWKTYLDTRHKHQFQLARAAWNGDYLDPANFLELLQSGTGNNDGLYTNPKFDDLLKKAGTLPNGPERMAALSQAEDIAITQDAALIPIYFYVSIHLIDLKKWGGWDPNPLNNHPWQFIYKK